MPLPGLARARMELTCPGELKHQIWNGIDSHNIVMTNERYESEKRNVIHGISP